MYENYGDVNFFDTGILVETTEDENEFNIITCGQVADIENTYLFGSVQINITDSWIDKHGVCSYCGLRDVSIDYTDEEKLQFAIGVVSYYGNHCGGEWKTLSKNEIIDEVERKYDIESDFYADNFSEDNRNVVVEFFSHLGTGTTRQVYDTMEEALEYFADFAENGDSITLIEK